MVAFAVVVLVSSSRIVEVVAVVVEVVDSEVRCYWKREELCYCCCCLDWRLRLLSFCFFPKFRIGFLSGLFLCSEVWLGIKGGDEKCQWRRTRRERTALIL